MSARRRPWSLRESEPRRSAPAERTPDAGSAKTGDHREPNHELHEADASLHEHVPRGPVGRQHANELQRRGGDPQQASEEGHEDEPERPPPGTDYPDSGQHEEG